MILPLEGLPVEHEGSIGIVSKLLSLPAIPVGVKDEAGLFAELFEKHHSEMNISVSLTAD